MASSPYRAEHLAWIRDHPLVEGTICPRCGMPMYKRQALDAGHAVDVVRGGASGPRRWEHRRCNRSAGGKLGGVKPAPKQQDDNSQSW